MSAPLTPTEREKLKGVLRIAFSERSYTALELEFKRAQTRLNMGVGKNEKQELELYREIFRELCIERKSSPNVPAAFAALSTRERYPARSFLGDLPATIEKEGIKLGSMEREAAQQELVVNALKKQFEVQAPVAARKAKAHIRKLDKAGKTNKH